ncbi:MAG TPA: hypothetical protein VFG88_10415 [Nocardioidaceae bacterium]|nr:hypothetical protein [Nocardioidaceae bacterium]
MSREHKRPILAFVVLFMLAAAVVGNGLRAEADRGRFIAAGPIAVHAPPVHGRVGEEPVTPSPRQLLETSLEALEPSSGAAPATGTGATGDQRTSLVPSTGRHETPGPDLAVPGQGGPRAPGGTVGVPAAGGPGERASHAPGRGHIRHVATPQAGHQTPPAHHRRERDRDPADNGERSWSWDDGDNRGNGWGHRRDSDQAGDRRDTPGGHGWGRHSGNAGHGLGAAVRHVADQLHQDVEHGIGDLVRGLTGRRGDRASGAHGRPFDHAPGG